MNTQAPLGAFLPYCPLDKSMTTSQLPEAQTSDKELRAFPPVSDAVDYVKQINWTEVGQRCRTGVHNVGFVLAIFGEKIHDLGTWLSDV